MKINYNGSQTALILEHGSVNNMTASINKPHELFDTLSKQWPAKNDDFALSAKQEKEEARKLRAISNDMLLSFDRLKIMENGLI